MNNVVLSSNCFQNVNWDLLDNDFTFYIGDFQYECHHIFAEFLSPHVQEILLQDNSLREYHFATSEYQEVFESLFRMKDDGFLSIEESQLYGLYSIGLELGNEEFIRLGFPQTVYTNDNVFQYLANKIKCHSDIQPEILFICEHFSEIERSKLNTIEPSIIELIISSSTLCINNEDYLYDFIVEYLTIHQDSIYLFENIYIDYLSAEYFHRYLSQMITYFFPQFKSRLLNETQNESKSHHYLDSNICINSSSGYLHRLQEYEYIIGDLRHHQIQHEEEYHILEEKHSSLISKYSDECNTTRNMRIEHEQLQERNHHLENEFEMTKHEFNFLKSQHIERQNELHQIHQSLQMKQNELIDNTHHIHQQESRIRSIEEENHQLTLRLQQNEEELRSQIRNLQQEQEYHNQLKQNYQRKQEELTTIQNHISQMKNEKTQIEKSFEDSKREIIRLQSDLNIKNKKILEYENPNMKKIPHSNTNHFVGIFDFLTKNLHITDLSQSNEVKITVSSYRNNNQNDYNQYNVIKNNDNFWHSQDQPNQWIEFEFQRTQIKIESYSLKSAYLKSWKVEGKNKNGSYELINEIKDNFTFQSGNWAFGYFICSRIFGPFQSIRITQTGPNHSNNYHFIIRQIEFFGEIEIK